MIFPATQATMRGRDFLRLMDAVKVEAATELAGALAGISTKAITAAGVPGAGAYFLSRAANGDSCNPLYRLPALLLLMKRVGLKRHHAQRLVDWLQDWIDRVWPVEDERLEDAIRTDQELDPKDDTARFEASHGCIEAARELLRRSEEQRAHKRTLCVLLRQRIEAGSAS